LQVHRFVSLAVASRLIGMSERKCRVAAQAGRFGPVVHAARGGPALVSTRGLELASGVLLCEAAVHYAEENFKHDFRYMPLLQGTGETRQELDPIAVSARVIREHHEDIGELEFADD
jgi:hypothetical protein